MIPPISRWLFDQVHSRNLIYNQCWEDPALDREVLNIEPSDRIVMITSAGCNALDYLIRGPLAIDCVDMNPFQNALLELKLVALNELSYSQFFEMFGHGKIQGHRTIYKTQLRGRLSESGRSIWDARIGYFDPDGAGLYFHGASGFFARMIRWYLAGFCGLRGDLDDFQGLRTLDAQAEFYRTRIAPKLWRPEVQFLLRRPALLSLLGVPIEQMRQIEQTTGTSVSAFIKNRVEKTLTQIPIAENYFWRVYMNGHHTPDCCPDYLKRENFHRLRDRASRISIHTKTVTQFLRSASGRFSIFVLLDHMDWLAARPALLEDEWRSIMLRALPGARIIYRSGGISCRYIPEFAAKRLEFQTARTAELNERDRVGTYGSFHFARVTA